MKIWLKKYALTILVILSIPIIIYLSPLTGNKNNIPKYFNQDFEKGRVVSVLEEELEPDEAVPERLNGKTGS